MFIRSNRIRAFSICLAILVSNSCHAASSVDAGFVKDHTYHSEYFHFAYEIPTSLQAVPLNSLNLPQNDPKGNAFGLLAAREFGGSNPIPSGVLLHVDNVAHYKGQVNRPVDYLGKIMRQWPRHYTSFPEIKTLVGITFDRIDYSESATDFESIVVGISKGYAVIFKFNAHTQNDLDAMVRSVETIRNDP